MRSRTKGNPEEYRITIRPLSKDEGGGYLVEYPEIPGCMSDGETVEEAIANGREALRDCLDVLKESGRKAPRPGIEAAQWRQRLPRTLYLKLTEQAKSEGVSINSLVTAMIAEAIGARRGKRKPARTWTSATQKALALKGSMSATEAEALSGQTQSIRASYRKKARPSSREVRRRGR